MPAFDRRVVDVELATAVRPLHPLLVRARATARAHRAAEHEVSVTLGQMGLSTAKCLVLEAFVRGPRDGLCIEELSRFLGVHRTSASAAVDSLVGLGWLTKGHDSNDRRKMQLSISEQGVRVLEEARGLLAEQHPLG